MKQMEALGPRPLLWYASAPAEAPAISRPEPYLLSLCRWVFAWHLGALKVYRTATNMQRQMSSYNHI